MWTIIQKNALYLSAYMVFFIALFIFIISTDQLDATLFFSAHRTLFGDFFFRWVTLLGEVYPFVGIILFFIFRKNRRSAQKMAISGVLILIVISLLKSFFAYDRPVIILENMGYLPTFHFVTGVEALRGATSFPSGHSGGAFALWTLLSLHVKNNKTLQLLCLLVAISVGISRVYLTHHFPEDVLFGSAIGVATALLIEYLMENVFYKKV